MKKIILLALLMGLSACSSPATQKISAAKAKSMMEKQTVIIVDVRTADEYKEGHIAKAILIPNESIGSTPPASLPNKDAIILVYCRSGNRSKQAAEKLAAMGYTHIFDFGGIIDWPYGIEK